MNLSFRFFFYNLGVSYVLEITVSHDEVKSRLNSENASNLSVRNHLSSRHLVRSMNMKYKH